MYCSRSASGIPVAIADALANTVTDTVDTSDAPMYIWHPGMSDVSYCVITRFSHSSYSAEILPSRSAFRQCRWIAAFTSRTSSVVVGFPSWHSAIASMFACSAGAHSHSDPTSIGFIVLPRGTWNVIVPLGIANWNVIDLPFRRPPSSRFFSAARSMSSCIRTVAVPTMFVIDAVNRRSPTLISMSSVSAAGIPAASRNSSTLGFTELMETSMLLLLLLLPAALACEPRAYARCAADPVCANALWLPSPRQFARFAFHLGLNCSAPDPALDLAARARTAYTCPPGAYPAIAPDGTLECPCPGDCDPPSPTAFMIVLLLGAVLVVGALVYRRAQ